MENAGVRQPACMIDDWSAALLNHCNCGADERFAESISIGLSDHKLPIFLYCSVSTPSIKHFYNVQVAEFVYYIL